ncbi:MULTISPECIES: DUF3500 domain-containing protein [unclassified Corynebacterium]|uniref:DUF3500 domain-containing protein n=1 Tax=unclassified Corynebacterium TaxID=2624378 RepID=UPI0029CA80BC|nr:MULTISPECIES: DUF3500 domain-containing protein [unclassified Corynebacterium]WPF66176.1 DUF3500 domain-containing protein [Corynebacterium sp. 22KM0430]WPF68668.1 DUF3500 domain-containing protein [Corynebacterium sp. 21KM1197]
MTSKNRRLLPLAASALIVGLTLGACSSADTADTANTTNTSTDFAATSTSTTASTSNIAATGAASASSNTSTQATVQATATAAQDFLNTLSEEQKATVVKDYADEDKSITWSNFPVTFVERAGINLKDLSEEQRAAAMNVLKALLNDDAYATVTNIMAGDEYLLNNSNTTEDSLGQYYIAFYGNPSDTEAWTLQFGGHHLGLNATMDTDSLTFAPTHLGTQPTEWINEQGQTITTMDKTYTSAFAFYDSLSEEQKNQLYQGEQVATMVCAPGSTCDYPTGTGLKGSDLTDEQKDLLIDVVANWAGMADEETTATQLDAIRATLDDTYVNWSGATTYDTSTGEGIYFQISGPKVYIEFANQNGSAGADVEGVITAGWGHVHTIYRDPSNDYANSVEQQEGSGPGAGGPGAGGPGAPSEGGTPPSGAPRR